MADTLGIQLKSSPDLISGDYLKRQKNMTTEKPINTFIIPTVNNVEGLIKCVESIYKYTPPNFRIISIFNGTMEDFITAYTSLEDKVHMWIKPGRNLGFGKSMNQGIKLAQTEFVTLANDDVELIYEGWWEDIMKLYEEHPNMGGFNPHSFINKKHTGERVIQYDQKDEYTAEDIVKMKEIFRSEHWYAGLICTYFTICKKEMFDKIGLFDESFGLGSGEDYDLCVRATRGGYMIAGGSKVMVKHWWGGTKDNLPKDENFISNYNLIAAGNQHMTRKWGPHSDEVKRQVESGAITEETAKELGWGWPGGGPAEPFDKETVSYPNKQFYQEVDL